jgi:hypothetical protein
VIQVAASNLSMAPPFDDGSMLLIDERFDISGSERQQQYIHLMRGSPEGQFVDSLGRFPLFETIPIRIGGEMRIAIPAFSARTAIAAYGWEFYAGERKTYEVAAFGLDGSLKRLIRWSGQDRTVTPADVEAYKSGRLHRVDDESQRRAELDYLSAMPFEESFPAYEEIRVDSNGFLWIRALRRPRAEGPQRWLVIDPQGQALGEVEIPEGLRVLEIGDDYVLGVQRDDLDVEHVRVYGLLKKGRT